eukprot:m.163283 g.163283  ORF g.163283 m.163283 type:complete len:139 (+) comp16389_c0_seq11:2939-3355(+)
MKSDKHIMLHTHDGDDKSSETCWYLRDLHADSTPLMVLMLSPLATSRMTLATKGVPAPTDDSKRQRPLCSGAVNRWKDSTEPVKHFLLQRQHQLRLTGPLGVAQKRSRKPCNPQKCCDFFEMLEGVVRLGLVTQNQKG